MSATAANALTCGFPQCALPPALNWTRQTVDSTNVDSTNVDIVIACATHAISLDLAAMVHLAACPAPASACTCPAPPAGE